MSMSVCSEKKKEETKNYNTHSHIHTLIHSIVCHSCGFPNGTFETFLSDWYCGNMWFFIHKQSETSSFEDKAELPREAS